ncbi:MAG: dual specificity protein phosphatase family protein [Proteobacteria bacterium]|nr:dual specificity protein phosphatase family protein [Pseudomonadota bacterium]
MRSEHLSKSKLVRFLESGVTYFIDLTEAGEIRPYEPDLEGLAEDRAIDVCYRRFPIRDGGVPPHQDDLQQLLNTITEALCARHVVYIHCLGGIGRTGLVVGCYLAEKHGSGPQGLAKLQGFWTKCEKSAYQTTTPETEEQRQWILAWGSA